MKENYNTPINPLHAKELNKSKISTISEEPVSSKKDADSPDSSDEMVRPSDSSDAASVRGSHNRTKYILPNMWSKQNVGLYCQYMAVGLLYGAGGTVLPFCAYVKGGEDQVCSNASSVVFLAWNFKILFAIATDIFRPFGYRRKSWMMIGWSLALIMLLLLAVIPTESLSVSAWIGLLMLTQAFVMVSDVPSDGYCVQLGQMEPPEQRGQILSTGQLMRFIFSMIAGVIQTFFLNSAKTSPPNSDLIWSWGLSMNGYYGLLFAIVFVLCIPIYFLEEINDVPIMHSDVVTGSFSAMDEEFGDTTDKAAHSISLVSFSKEKNLLDLNEPTPTRIVGSSKVAHVQKPTWEFFKREIWAILQNQTTLYLLIYVIGFHSLAGITNIANTFVQFYVIQLTQMQAVIDALTSYLALVTAVWIFKRYLLAVNWRYTQWGSCFISLLVGLMWIPAYHPNSGVMNPWYTIFVDLDGSFVSGLAQVLYSLSVIELAQPGLEATTYELLVTVGNASLTISSIIGTQLLAEANSIGCQLDDYTQCPPDSVSIISREAFVATDGPSRYTNYNWMVFGVSAINASIWVWFLPRNIAQCAEWKAEGQKKGNSKTRGIVAATLCVLMVGYGFICAVLLLNPKTSCLKFVGGTGCKD